MGVNGFLECKKISKQEWFCYGMCIKLRFGWGEQKGEN